MAKCILLFVSEQKITLRLKDLRKWLLNCGYPESVIDKSCFNAKLIGPANSKNILPLVSACYSSFNMQNIIKSIFQKLKQSLNESIKVIFGETHTVLSLKQPPNVPRLLSINRKSPRLPQGLLNCYNKNCKLYALYIKACVSFKTWNNVIWYIRSHITCQSKSVIYVLKCTSCNYSTTCIHKTVDFQSRKNKHTTFCRPGGSTDKFDNHVFYCM